MKPVELIGKKQEVKKHIAAIHCSNSLTLLQRKISNALLYHAHPELMEKAEHEITIKQLCAIIGYFGNNHAAIKESLLGLVSTVMEWNIINDEADEEDKEWDQLDHDHLDHFHQEAEVLMDLQQR